MPPINVGHLIQNLAQWVRQTPDRPCMDVEAFARLAGVRFALLEDASVRFMFGVLPGGLIPLEQVSAWLRFESMQPASDVGEAERAAMRALVADAAAYATTIAPPLDVLASHHARRAAAGPSGLLLTEQAIRTLHARLLAGDSHAQATAAAGLPQTLARSVQRRGPLVQRGQLGAVWRETFDAQPVPPRGRGRRRG